jgi:uncharacterized membrane protein YkvA (DUF1232 family)
MNDERVPPIYQRPPLGKPPGFLRRVAGWVAHKFLVLWYVGRDPHTPKWAKVTLFGSLLYLFPFGVPLDFLPPIGEEFDLGALLLAVGTFLFSIRKHHLIRANETARQWFGGQGARQQPEPPVIEIEKPH